MLVHRKFLDMSHTTHFDDETKKIYRNPEVCFRRTVS